MRATELPTVPNPKSAMRSGGRTRDSCAEKPVDDVEAFSSDTWISFYEPQSLLNKPMIPDARVDAPACVLIPVLM
jgi:hypothetical protein